MMEVNGIAETSRFVENLGLRPNIPRRNFNKNYFFVADNVVHTHTHTPVSYTHLFFVYFDWTISYMPGMPSLLMHLRSYQSV